ncbi:hypothetical protein D9613_012507 [Agrocybe pediades]|uniref:Uncharacterized protein n=1 Tax=Agrocybe pediades TaxID=84607 RepID=A0A8H4QR62_9AGAR|nr:hypothetical protein D9613_012507 [Agrocybe pediades]
MKGRLYRKDTDSPGSASKSKRSPIHTVIINEDADSHLDTDSEDQRAARIQEPAGTMVFLTSPGSTIAVNSYARNAIAGSNMSFRHWDITGQRYRGSLSTRETSSTSYFSFALLSLFSRGLLPFAGSSPRFH